MTRLRIQSECFQPSLREPLPLTQLSVVIPCYNEEEVLSRLQARLFTALQELGMDWEVIFVDDGSRDTTQAQLTALHWDDPRFKVIALSRNFGHQTAISAGLAYASGEIVAIIDADLQDPPELLGQCVEKLNDGFDVVYAVRRKRKERLIKRVAYSLFYRLLRAVADAEMPLDAGDFCVMRRRVADVLRRMPEREPFIRGLRAWAGFRQTGIEYERAQRAAGKTKYSVTKLMRLATDGIFSFSILPLRASVFLGFGALVVAVAWAILHLVWRIAGFRLMGHTAAELPGWTALMCGMVFLGGLQLLILGCAGEYIGRIYMEIKHRPRWIVRKALGIEREVTQDSDLQSRAGFGELVLR